MNISLDSTKFFHVPPLLPFVATPPSSIPSVSQQESKESDKFSSHCYCYFSPCLMHSAFPPLFSFSLPTRLATSLPVCPIPHQAAPNLSHKIVKQNPRIRARVRDERAFWSLSQRPLLKYLKEAGPLLSSKTELLLRNWAWIIRTSAHVDCWSREGRVINELQPLAPPPINIAAHPLHSVHLILSIFFLMCQWETIRLVSSPSIYSPYSDYQERSVF